MWLLCLFQGPLLKVSLGVCWHELTTDFDSVTHRIPLIQGYFWWHLWFPLQNLLWLLSRQQWNWKKVTRKCVRDKKNKKNVFCKMTEDTPYIIRFFLNSLNQCYGLMLIAFFSAAFFFGGETHTNLTSWPSEYLPRTWMWTCCRPASSTVESSPSCCPRFRGSGGDRSRSLRRSAGAPWWAVLWSSAPKPTPRSAAALRPACRRALPRRSSASAAARRSRQACSTASLFLPCTRVDLQQHTHTNTSQVPDVHWSPSQLLWKPFIKL